MNHQELLTELKALLDKEYREEYLRSLVQIGVSSQIRALRGDRSQKEFATLIGMPQSVISERLENPDYSGLNTSTLVSVANALQVGLLVRFVSYPELLQRTEDVSERALRVPTIAQSLSGLSTAKTSHVVRLPTFGNATGRPSIARPATESIVTYDVVNAVRRVSIGRTITTGGFLWQEVQSKPLLASFLHNAPKGTVNTMQTIAK